MQPRREWSLKSFSKYFSFVWSVFQWLNAQQLKLPMNWLQLATLRKQALMMLSTLSVLLVIWCWKEQKTYIALRKGLGVHQFQNAQVDAQILLSRSIIVLDCLQLSQLSVTVEQQHSAISVNFRYCALDQMFHTQNVFQNVCKILSFSFSISFSCSVYVSETIHFSICVKSHFYYFLKK